MIETKFWKFQSAFNFFYGRHKLKKGYLKSKRFQCDPECILEPYFSINGNQSGVPVTEFLENMEKNFDPKMKHAYRVQNYQGIGSNSAHFSRKLWPYDPSEDLISHQLTLMTWF